MSLGKHEVDRLLGIERQMGSSQGWFMSLVRCPQCKRTLWSNKKELYCPTCVLSKEIKK